MSRVSMPAAVTIAPRFCGPPKSGNGGYTAGLIAEAIAAGGHAPPLDGGPTPALSVRLRLPPPLVEPLRVAPEGNGRFGVRPAANPESALIAEASWQPMPDLDAPPPVSLEAARGAERHSIAWDQDRFGTCFVCGSARRPGDGLRIFAGPVAGAPRANFGTQVATLWQPDALLGADGRVAPRYLWSALDCPGYFAVTAGKDDYLLLAQMSAHIHELPATGEPLIVQAWPLVADRGGKTAGSAIYAADGRLLAAAHTRWKAPRAASAPPPGADQLQHAQQT